MSMRIATLALAGALSVSTAQAQQDAPAPGPVRTGYVLANGINYYYEIHGQGAPLLLLHGGLGSIELFEPALPALARERQVIAIDLQGHGRTELGDRPIRYQDIADDLAEVVRKAGFDSVDVMGYSMGGGIALRLAIQHPGIVRRLVLVSTPYAQDGFYPEMLPQQAAVGAAMAEQMKGSPIYQSYMAVAPRPQDFPRLLDRMGEWMRTPYDWSDEVKGLKGPVMLVYGDADMIRPEHMVSFYQLLGGGLRDAGWQREHMSRNRLAILPNVTHYEMAMASALPGTVLPFLNGEDGPPGR